MARRVRNFLDNQYLDSLYEAHPEINQFLYYDREIHELVIDDPQLTFYLLNTSPERLRKVAGKIESNPRTKVFISYAHKDAQIGVDANRGINQSYFERLRVHLNPLEQEGIIDLWDDTKIQISSLWRRDIEKALSSARVALLLVSGNFLASEFIQRNELPQLLADAKEAGLIVIPIMLSPARLPAIISEIQAANSPDRPLTAMDYNQQEELFADLAKYIEESLSEQN
jgi:hypothetical protein